LVVQDILLKNNFIRVGMARICNFSFFDEC